VQRYDPGSTGPLHTTHTQKHTYTHAQKARKRPLESRRYDKDGEEASHGVGMSRVPQAHVNVVDQFMTALVANTFAANVQYAQAEQSHDRDVMLQQPVDEDDMYDDDDDYFDDQGDAGDEYPEKDMGEEREQRGEEEAYAAGEARDERLRDALARVALLQDEMSESETVFRNRIASVSANLQESSKEALEQLNTMGVNAQVGVNAMSLASRIDSGIVPLLDSIAEQRARIVRMPRAAVDIYRQVECDLALNEITRDLDSSMVPSPPGSRPTPLADAQYVLDTFLQEPLVVKVLPHVGEVAVNPSTFANIYGIDRLLGDIQAKYMAEVRLLVESIRARCEQRPAEMEREAVAALSDALEVATANAETNVPRVIEALSARNVSGATRTGESARALVDAINRAFAMHIEVEVSAPNVEGDSYLAQLSAMCMDPHDVNLTQMRDLAIRLGVEPKQARFMQVRDICDMFALS